jgi:glycosyltransferase involved in cell wall biosynthesis
MKIIYIYQSDYIGPGEKLHFYMANELARHGHQTMALVNGDPATIATMSQKPEFEYHRLEFQGVHIAPSLWQKIERFKPDLAHAQYIRNEPFQAGLDIKRRLGIPLVVHHDDSEEAIYHMRFERWWEAPISHARLLAGTWLHPKWWHWYNPYLKSKEAEIDAHESLTEAIKEDLKKRCGYDVEHIFLGLDIDAFRLPPEPDKSHLPPGVNPEDFVVMYNGALHRYTLPDFEMLLDAIGVAQKRIPNIKLVFSGSNFRKEAVNQAIRQRQLESRVVSVGLIPTMGELREHFAYANVFVQPGKKTNFNELRLPSKLMFNMAACRPIITFDFGFGRLLTHQKDAILYEKYTPEVIAQSILWIHDHPDRAIEIGRAAGETAERLFDVKKTSQQYLRLYERTLAAKKGAR